MRILLLQAAFTRDYGITNPPLGLMYISAMLKRGGYSEVKILHLDLIKDSWKREAEAFRPDIAGIGALTAQALSLHEAAAWLKQTFNIPVVAGGPHAAHYPESVAADPNIDVAVTGEGELVFTELVRRFEAGRPGFSGLSGVAYRGPGGELVSVPPEYIRDLDSLPPPDWGAIDIGAYTGVVPCSVFAHGTRHMPVMTSRGCPYGCSYCHHVMGRRYRAHSPARVVAEIRELAEKHGVTDIEVMDDNVNLDRRRFRELLLALAAAGLGRVRIYLAGGLHAGTLDEELIGLFRPAGINYFAIGIESGSPRVQKLIGKGLDLDRVRRLIACAEGKGIFTHGLFMIGVPGETAEDIRLTTEFAVRSRLHTMLLSTCFVYRGTALASGLGAGAEMSEEADINHYSGYSGFSGRCECSPAELRRLKFLMNVKFYYSPARAWRIFRDLPRWSASLLLVLFKKFLIRSLPFS